MIALIFFFVEGLDVGWFLVYKIDYVLITLNFIQG